jgi:hypothetical protein
VATAIPTAQQIAGPHRRTNFIGLKVSCQLPERVAVRLTLRTRPDKLKSMSRIIFAVLLGALAAGPAKAQEVPGRDLWSFPLAALAQPRPLGGSAASSIWNPAAALIRRPVKTDVAVAALTTPLEQGVEGRILSASWRVRDDWTANATIGSLSISDVLRTETDPQSLGEIPYGTSIMSIGGAGRWRSATVGAALRFRSGSVDTDSRMSPQRCCSPWTLR